MEKTEFKINGITYGFWATQRPLTKTWGSGQVFDRLSKQFGEPDIVFGKTDNIPNGTFCIDKNPLHKTKDVLVCSWDSLPYCTTKFNFGYWDPPYPPAVKGLMKTEAQEIWRVCKKLAILHPYVYPRSWFKNAKRIGMIAVTFGPLKVIRLLQIFEKTKNDRYRRIKG